MRRIVLLMTLVGAFLAGFLYLELTEDQVDGGGIIGPSAGGLAVEPSALGVLAAPAEPKRAEVATSLSGRASVARPTLTLVVTSSAGGRELPAATARLLLADAVEGEEGRALSTGAGRATALDIGIWQVTLEAARHLPSTRTIELEAGDELIVSVTLVRGCEITGNAENRLGESLSRGRLIFLPEGRAYPHFPRQEEGLAIGRFDRSGNLEPMLVGPGRYTLCYGSYGSPDLELPCTIQAGVDRHLQVVFGGQNTVRFELDPVPEGNRRVEVRLEVPRDQEERGSDGDEENERRQHEPNPNRIARAAARGKDLQRWRAQGRATIRDGVGTIHRARAGTYRITLVSKPGEYSAPEMLELSEDESIVVHISVPPLPERSGSRRNDPKIPNEGPLQVNIERNGFPSERRPAGIYWL